MLTIRAARLEDAAAIASIQNELHETTAIAWTHEPQTVEGRTTWLHHKAADGHPVLIAEDDGNIVGFGPG